MARRVTTIVDISTIQRRRDGLFKFPRLFGFGSVCCRFIGAHLSIESFWIKNSVAHALHRIDEPGRPLAIVVVHF